MQLGLVSLVVSLHALTHHVHAMTLSAPMTISAPSGSTLDIEVRPANASSFTAADVRTAPSTAFRTASPTLAAAAVALSTATGTAFSRLSTTQTTAPFPTAAYNSTGSDQVNFYVAGSGTVGTGTVGTVGVNAVYTGTAGKTGNVQAVKANATVTGYRIAASGTGLHLPSATGMGTIYAHPPKNSGSIYPPIDHANAAGRVKGEAGTSRVLAVVVAAVIAMVLV